MKWFVSDFCTDAKYWIGLDNINKNKMVEFLSNNNYYFSANYIAPDKQHDGYFTKSTWNKQHYPKMMNRAKEVRAKNANESPEEHKIFVKKSVKRLKNLSKKLKAQGIDLTFNLGRKKV